MADPQVDLALIRSEALYCLRRDQLVRLCKRRGVSTKGKNDELANALRKSIAKARNDELTTAQPKVVRRPMQPLATANFPTMQQDARVPSMEKTTMMAPSTEQRPRMERTSSDETPSRESPSLERLLSREPSMEHAYTPLPDVAPHDQEVASMCAQSNTLTVITAPTVAQQGAKGAAGLPSTSPVLAGPLGPVQRQESLKRGEASRPKQHHVVLFHPSSEAGSCASRPVQDFHSGTSALEKAGVPSLFPDVRHESTPVSYSETTPLTHGDMRKIYAELLAEREQARAKKLPQRVGMMMRRVRSLLDTNPPPRGSQARAKAQPYTAPPTPVKAAASASLAADEAMLHGAMQARINKSAYAQRTPPLSTMQEQPEPAATSSWVPPASEGTIFQGHGPVQPTSPVCASLPPVEEDETTITVELVPTEREEVDEVTPSDADRASNEPAPTSPMLDVSEPKAPASEVHIAIPSTNYCQRMTSNARESVSSPPGTDAPESLDDMIDKLGWDEAIERLQKEPSRTQRSLRSTRGIDVADNEPSTSRSQLRAAPYNDRVQQNLAKRPFSRPRPPQ